MLMALVSDISRYCLNLPLRRKNGSKGYPRLGEHGPSPPPQRLTARGILRAP